MPDNRQGEGIVVPTSVLKTDVSKSRLIVPSGTEERSALSDAWRNAHAQSDTDIDRFAQHHTLGTSPNQAAAGNHSHNYFLEAHPVGALYLTVDPTNPGDIYGGTWVAWGSGRVPVGVDTSQIEFDTVEETGGSNTHTLTINEMPAHTHRQNISVSTGGSFFYMPKGGGGTLTVNSTDHSNTNTGGGQPHNNLQPYITCYMWKRTA